jgi:hypothetical protein
LGRGKKFGFRFVVNFRINGPMIELAESAEGKDEINAANVTRIMTDRGLSVHVIQNFVKVSAGIDRTMNVEALKIDINDFIEHGPVLGQPDSDGWVGWKGLPGVSESQYLRCRSAAARE